jgi:hypothetical protein
MLLKAVITFLHSTSAGSDREEVVTTITSQASTYPSLYKIHIMKMMILMLMLIVMLMLSHDDSLQYMKLS